MNYRANESRDKAVGELVEPCFDYAEPTNERNIKLVLEYCRARRRKTKLVATEEGEANEEKPKD